MKNYNSVENFTIKLEYFRKRLLKGILRGYFKEMSDEIGLMIRVIANGPADWGSVPGPVIAKTRKIMLDAIFLNTLRYKVRIKGKVELSREWSSACPYTSVL